MTTTKATRIERWRVVGMIGLSVISGVVIGMFIPLDQLRHLLLPPTQETQAVAEAEAAADSDIFDVTLAAQQTMGLLRGTPTLGNYMQHVSIPAFVRERPAVSNLQASSKLAGIVRRIFVDVGQSVREGDPLLELELTGEGLAESQSTFLDAHKQLEIVHAEIERLLPVSASGGVARKSLIEKQYEERRLRALIESKEQELLVKGLTREQLTGIALDGTLVRSIIVHVPTGIRPTDRSRTVGLTQDSSALRATSFPVAAASEDPWVYSIEQLYVSPGTMAGAGENLCDLAYHATLLVEGQAYERDLPRITQFLQSREGVTIEVGDDASPERLPDVPILYMDNHVDPATQTIRFYMELQNVVTSETQNETGALFRSWKYRPAQRGHVFLPAQQWSDKLIVPIDAVARDGLDSIVFRHLGEHSPIGEVAHSEFQKVIVQVIYQDRRSCVIERGGYLSDQDEIALNNAYLLLLQMNKSDGEGGHHHHDH